MNVIPRVKQPSKLPIALTPKQIDALFKSMDNLKHKTMLAICYSGGLWVGKLLNFKIYDIYSDTMRIRIRDGKGLNNNACNNCGAISIAYNFCRNRHCPLCQSFKRKKWRVV